MSGQSQVIERCAVNAIALIVAGHLEFVANPSKSPSNGTCTSRHACVDNKGQKQANLAVTPPFRYFQISLKGTEDFLFCPTAGAL